MLAIIPARGGSKGLPRKNVLELGGKPLIAHTIEAALAAKGVARVIVSTDNQEIADVARRFGAEVPFLRPDHLATDTALAIDNYLYTVERLENETGASIPEIVVLQPTSPLRSSADIDSAIDLFRSKKADSVISVTEAAHPPQWLKKVRADGVLVSFLDRPQEGLNRQQYEKVYLPNGAVFVFRMELLRTARGYYSERTYPYVMPRDRSVDIDDRLDFDFAELLMRRSDHG